MVPRERSLSIEPGLGVGAKARLQPESIPWMKEQNFSAAMCSRIRKRYENKTAHLGYGVFSAGVVPGTRLEGFGGRPLDGPSRAAVSFLVGGSLRRCVAVYGFGGREMTLPLLSDPAFSPRILRVNAVWFRPRSGAEGDYKVEGDVLVQRGNVDEVVRQRFEAGSLEDLFVKMNVFLEGEKQLAREAAQYSKTKTEEPPGKHS